MEFDFKTVMANKTNAELLAVLSEPEKYQPDALNTAKDEMSKRNLSEEEIATSQNVYESEKLTIETKANEGLQLRDYLILLLPLIGIFIVSGMYKGAGYDRKAKQAAKIGLYYIIALFVLITLSRLF